SVAAVVDVCAELPCPTPGLAHASVPMLDLLPPDAEQIERALGALQQALATPPVLVCCALGLARSALVVAAWLLRSG
ncbi:MAG TPA: serine/threonine protein phosphatase, partial [Accumulibacter sp.]|nr:serine/threonine protein phosphatase [Accumulibacter sp.]